MATSISEVRSVEIAPPGKYLTFQLGQETYGLGILRVQEIIGLMHITRVPQLPSFIRGVLNLRGKVIPVIDLRIKFGMKVKPDSERTCIIVIQVHGQQGLLTLGVLVDEVSEVLDIDAEQIEHPPTFGGNIDTRFLLGMGKVGKEVVMLMDVDCVLSGGEMEQTELLAGQ